MNQKSVVKITSRNISQHEGIQAQMGYTELAYALFCATQAEGKIIREKITGIEQTKQAYLDVEKKVRQCILELGGTTF